MIKFGSHRYAQRLGLKVDAPNSKLSSKQLFKLALRLVKMFNLQLSEDHSFISSHSLIHSLTHLLTRSLTRSPIHTHLLTRSLTRSPIHKRCAGKFPGLASQRLVVCLHHLLRMRYLDGRSITEANMADLIAAAVRCMLVSAYIIPTYEALKILTPGVNVS